MIIFAPCNMDYDTDRLLHVKVFKDLARISKHKSGARACQNTLIKTEIRN
jgi:hypothetical protein